MPAFFQRLGWKKVRVGLVSVIFPVFLFLLIASTVIITIVSAHYAERSADRLSSYFLDQIGHRLQERVGTLVNTTERAAARVIPRVLRNTGDGDQAAITSANFPEISTIFLSELLIRGYEAFEYYGLGLPNHENLLIKREAPEFIEKHPRALFPISVVEYRINSTASAAAGSRVLDRFTSFVDRTTGELTVYETVRNDSFDVTTRSYYTGAVANGAPTWTPAIPFVFGRSGFLYATPLYAGGGLPPPGILGSILQPAERPPGTNTSENLKAVLTIGFQSFGISAYLASVRVAENGFAAIVADDNTGARRAIGWRNPEILMRPGPLLPGQGTTNEFVPTGELADPELRAMLLALPGDVHELHEDPDAGDHEHEQHDLSFDVGQESFVGRWVKVLGRPNDTSSLSLLVAVAALETGAPAQAARARGSV
eukprot:tig00000361_g24369.t1